MPLKKERCEGCGRTQNACPECGSNMVTPRENMRVDILYVIDYTEESEVEQHHVCWECGWKEELTITIERS